VGQVGLDKAGTEKTKSALPDLKSKTIPASQQLQHDADKNMLLGKLGVLNKIIRNK